MKFIYILLLTLIPFSSRSNNVINEYYSLINSAELQIASNHPQQALEIYQKAFVLHKPFFIDIYNATLCALKTDELDIAMDYCYLLAQKGVGEPYLRDKLIFKPLRNSNQLDDLLKFAHHCRDSISVSVLESNTLFKELVTADQQNALTNRKMNSGDTTANFPWVANIQDSLSNKLLVLFEQKGMMGENQLGVRLINDTDWSIHYTYDILFIHAMQLGSFPNRLRFWTLLQKEIENGNIDNRCLHHIAAFPGFFSGHPLPISGSKLWMIFDCKLYQKNIPDWLLARTEKLRQDFYFCNYEDLGTKSIYNVTHPNSPYRIGIPIEKGSAQIKTKFVDEMKSYKETKQQIPNCR